MKVLTTLTLITFGLFIVTMNPAHSSDEVVLPVISKPSKLTEGTQRTLTEEEINELLPWARDSRTALADLLDSEELYTNKENLESLINGVSKVLKDRTAKKAELLMRYILSRGLNITALLDREMDEHSVGSLDVKLRVMKTTIKMAISYYDMDEALLVKKTKQDYALFGLEYYEFLTELNKSIFDASAQYQIQLTAVEWFQWDLYRDMNNVKYAALIINIQKILKKFPDQVTNDSEAIELIREMKKMASNFEINVKGKKEKVLEKVAQVLKVDDQVLYEWSDKAGDVSTVIAVYDQESYGITGGYYDIRLPNKKIKRMVPRSDLAVTRGCTTLCVGDKIIYYPDNYINAFNTKGVIIGIKKHLFVIQHTSGKLKDTASKDITATELALDSGCSTSNICVGDKYQAMVDGQATPFMIHAIQPFDNYVIQYIGNDDESAIEPRMPGNFVSAQEKQ